MHPVLAFLPPPQLKGGCKEAGGSAAEGCQYSEGPRAQAEVEGLVW